MMKAFKNFMGKLRWCADGAVLFSTLLDAKESAWLYNSASKMSLTQVNFAGASLCDLLFTSGGQFLRRFLQ